MKEQKNQHVEVVGMDGWMDGLNEQWSFAHDLFKFYVMLPMLFSNS